MIDDVERLKLALIVYGGIKYTQAHLDAFPEPKRSKLQRLLREQELLISGVLASENDVDDILAECQKSVYSLL